MDTWRGLPAHPLIVHIPVAMLPLAALGVLVMLIRRSWYERYRWAVLLVGAIGTGGAILAASTGEALEHRIREVEGREAVRAIHEHAEAGDLARTMAIVFFVALAAWVIIPWFLDRRATANRRHRRYRQHRCRSGRDPSVGTHRQPFLAASVADGPCRAHSCRLNGHDLRRGSLRGE